MKRLFTICLLALAAAVSAEAQGYRKWDFTQWSQNTISNLQAEAQKGVTGGTWSDTEKADGSNPQVGKCYWSYGDNVIDGALAANGAIISETDGLVFNTAYTTRRSLAIAIDYPSTSLGDYAGPQYLWLGGGKNKIACFTIPKVRIGQKMTFVVESHKPAEGRGIELYVGTTDDENRIGESFTPKTQETYTWEEGWTVPAGATDNGDGTVDVIVYNTNGCHIYSIEVGDNSQKSKVGYLYNGSIDAELAYAQLSASDKYTVEPIEALGTFTADDLTAYDALVISSTVDNAYTIALLKSVQPFVPVLNLNPALYEAWGYGAIGAGHMFAVATNPSHALFKGIDLIENPDNENKAEVLALTQSTPYQGVTLSGLFADDQVLATVMESTDVAIHGHNLNHNGYIYIPYTQEALANAATPQLLLNALSVVVASKAKVTKAPAPSFSFEYKDKNTNVTISCGVPGAQIFYTLDGSTPTTESTPYTEPINVTAEGVTVKAVALGDGYLLSDVSEKAVDLKNQAPQPTIAMTQEDGKTIVTLTNSMEGAVIYYNYDGKTETAQSTLYTEPIAIDILGRTIYAFTVAEGYVNSELASQAVTIQNPKVRIDVLAHMDANATEYNNGSTSTAYYFSWGKDKAAYSYWDTSAEPTITTDPETGDEISVYPLSPEETVDFENGWMIGSRGQVVIWEKDGYTMNYGDTNGRNPATVDDIDPNFPIEKYFITLGEKANDGTVPYNAYIATTVAYAGPFDVVAYVGNGSKPDAAKEVQDHQNVVFEVSADKETWTQLGDTLDVIGPRLFHKFTRSYEGTDAVYLRARLAANNSKAQFYEIYIANEGEKSKALMSGINDQLADGKEARVATVYSLNGMRQNSLRRGINIVRYSDGTARKVMVK